MTAMAEEIQSRNIMNRAVEDIEAFGFGIQADTDEP